MNAAYAWSPLTGAGLALIKQESKLCLIVCATLCCRSNDFLVAIGSVLHSLFMSGLITGASNSRSSPQTRLIEWARYQFSYFKKPFLRYLNSEIFSVITFSSVFFIVGKVFPSMLLTSLVCGDDNISIFVIMLDWSVHIMISKDSFY